LENLTQMPQFCVGQLRPCATRAQKLWRCARSRRFPVRTFFLPPLLELQCPPRKFVSTILGTGVRDRDLSQLETKDPQKLKSLIYTPTYLTRFK